MIRIDKRIKDIMERDRKVFLTTTRGDNHFIADHGDGDFVYDVSGNKFIDFSSFISVYNLGVNGNKEIRAAVKAQVDKLMHAAFTDYRAELPVLFAEKLLKFFPSGFGKMFLSNSGTEANEAALKFSKLFTKRQYVLAFYNSFHGRTMGSLGLTASRAVHREHFGPFNNTLHAPFPYPYRCKMGHSTEECGMEQIDFIERNIIGKEAAGREIAAIFVEPIQGEGGYIVPSRMFMRELRRIADEHQILLVSDEVQAGYMRAGKFLAMDNFGIKADIYTMAKAVGGGLPMGVTVTKSSLGDIPAGAHANTFGGNLASVAAGYASLKYLEKNYSAIERNVRDNGKAIMKRLNEFKDGYEIVGDARGLGMMLAIELVKSKRGKEPAVMDRDKVVAEAFNNGLLLLPAGQSCIRIIPPLTVSRDSLDKGLDILEKAIKTVSR
ncbi:MAG: aminotransferase class III-fold pyridoxal phosphate-dependent enzyme [Candidatus Micrarchaeota archaeon]|nr:aminotransferase class III-fold pyridoxal phosphate-dependent enzyme [Candidatus Micrarchaeota archaeon]